MCGLHFLELVGIARPGVDITIGATQATTQPEAPVEDHGRSAQSLYRRSGAAGDSSVDGSPRTAQGVLRQVRGVSPSKALDWPDPKKGKRRRANGIAMIVSCQAWGRAPSHKPAVRQPTQDAPMFASARRSCPWRSYWRPIAKRETRATACSRSFLRAHHGAQDAVCAVSRAKAYNGVIVMLACAVDHRAECTYDNGE